MLVSHRFSTVRMADVIVVLDGARVAEVGSHDELMARGGRYAELYGIQAGRLPLSRPERNRVGRPAYPSLSSGDTRPPRRSPVLLRMSTLFLRTLREDPADAEVPSHRLLVRAGYIRRAAPGGYTWLPLGWRVLRNVEAIIRDEMDAMGAQEVHFPALLPKEPYDKSNRWTEYGDDVFRVKDRKGADYMLGPTHEEFFTLLVKDLYSSYKDLPLWIYQIQTKFRDEQRPRAGLLRGREFVMKDSYSFDVDDAGLDRSYAAHRDAYIRIFDRLGLDYVIVSALSGAMGGSKSEEFLTPGRGRRGHLRPVHDVRLRGQRRGAAHPGARRPSRTTTCRPRTSRTRPTPRPSRPSWRWPTAARTFAATTGSGPPATR